jgi:hypothetical protein
MPYLRVLSYRIITATLQTPPFDFANHIYVSPFPTCGTGTALPKRR